MAVGDVFKMVISFELPGTSKPGSNSVYFRQRTEVTILSGNLLVEDLNATWLADVKDLYRALIPSNLDLIQIDTVGITFPTFGDLDTINEVGLLSNAGAENLPAQTAPVLKFATGLRGKSYRGRNYLPPINEANFGGGQLFSAGYIAAVDAYVAAMNSMTSSFSSNQYDHTVYSKTLLLDNIVTEYVLRNKPGTQRRRQEITYG